MQDVRMHDNASLADFLRQTIDRELPNLNRLSDAEAAQSARGGWTRKQELGHLLDSAANNHQRFVRGALDPEYRGPGYEQDRWVDIHGYADMQWASLARFWYEYNSLLVHLIARIPNEALARTCYVGSYPPATLAFVIEDYVWHMQHHIDQILGRERITEYPGAKASRATP